MKVNKKDLKNFKYNQNRLKQALKQNNQKLITLETYAHSNNKLNKRNRQKYKSMSEKKFLNLEENKLLTNTLELDYLNFSQMIIEDKYLSNSFDEYENNKKINNRYEDCDTSLDTVQIEKEIENKHNEELNKTPSTVCNYYTNSELNSSNKKCDEDIKNNLNPVHKQISIINKIENNNNNNKIEKNNNNNKIENNNKNLNEIKNKKNLQNKGMAFIKVNRKKFDQPMNKKPINNIQKNNNIKKNLKKEKEKKEEQKNNYPNTNFYNGKTLLKNYINSPVLSKNKNKNNTLISGQSNNKMIKCRTASMDCLKYTFKSHSNSVYSNNNSIIKVNQNNSNHNLVYMNNEKIKKKLTQQKPIMLCFDQIKYDNYFISPTNNNKIIDNKKKTLTNNKSNQNILNNYLNANNKISNITASTIKVQTKYHNKSASYGIINKNHSIKTNNEKKMKSSHSSNKLTNNVKIINQNNLLKISKTLTEHNIVNKIQKTPKNSKMSFLSSVSSLQKTNYNSSAKVQKFLPFENSYLKMFSNMNSSKAKTQSELKQRKYLNFNGSNYSINHNNLYNQNNVNIEKNVKQKLIDRMNNAMKNNWNYLYPHQENESKKVLIQNISEIIQTPNKDNYYEFSNSGIKGKNNDFEFKKNLNGNFNFGSDDEDCMN